MTPLPQLALYTLMMYDRYDEDVLGGLLFYLQHEKMEIIPAVAAELRPLIIRRNTVAKHLQADSLRAALPPMLQSPRDCSRCFQLHNCSLLHKAFEAGTADTSGLGDVFEVNYNERFDLQSRRTPTQMHAQVRTAHLKPLHTAYMTKWLELCELEARESSRHLSELWSLPAQVNRRL